MRSFSLQGNIVDVFNKNFYWGEINVEKGVIKSIIPLSPVTKKQSPYILPGFIDSHVHIESSMLVPSEFARLAVVHGTVSTISDPHEIANVCGMKGVEFMIENGKTVPFKFNFGAPSCVPATTFETAGATLNADDVKQLLEREEIKYLSEMMNFPGVLHKDEEVMKKIAAAHALNKPIDGHAPGLRGEQAKQYIEASLNPSEGETSASNYHDAHYKYETADPVLYSLLKSFVMKHRQSPTPAEIAMWEWLRGKKMDGHKFRRQHIIGTFIADFVCLAKKLIIEVDGLVHQLPDNKINDEERTAELNKLGFEVMRFKNEEVLHNTDKVIAIVLEKLRSIGVRSEDASKISPSGGGGAVISTDHECFTAEEALDKLKYGMKILIREGSAAKNFEALIGLMNEHYENMMFCSDDKHPDSLVAGHINQLCARAVAKGVDVFKVLQAACVNPALHYKLDVGLLKKGDSADFIVAEDLTSFNILQTYINGELVAENGKSLIKTKPSAIINNFSCNTKTVEDFRYYLHKWGEEENIEQVNVIEALDGQLITNRLLKNINEVRINNNFIESNTDTDILKIVVVNRYNNAPVAKSFIKNFGLKKGAIASSVAHDSHNIVAVGVDDKSLCKAINLIIDAKGGISCVNENQEMILALPVAGLMSNDDGYKIAQHYTVIDNMVKSMGSTLAAPFMTLSFMALLVIPHLKLSDKGLFNGDAFCLV
ncbi:MAG TPA: adenine deaminase C-terminal domain-containing protein [Chitinophagaceae bacterium]|nr:adenine deaminase C-terminal domain-containing protein [Chitinophagaceae bacterium]